MKCLLSLSAIVVLMSGNVQGQKKSVQRLNIAGGNKKVLGKALSKETAKAFVKLKGKWIVRSVQRDGKPNAAQIGQKIGDIITIRKNGAALMLG